MKIVFTLALVIQALPLFVLAQQEPLQQGTPKSANYPQMKSTGDVQADEANWLKAKDEWIRNYPDEYRALGGNPELLQSRTATDAEAKPTEMLVLPSFEVKKSYKLEALKAIPVAGFVLTSEDIDAETTNIQRDFTVGALLLQQGNAGLIRLFENPKIDLRALEKRNGNAIEWFFENPTCANCSKTIYLTLESETAEKVIYLMQSEDSDSKFVYRFVFIKI